jgi:hypothetical protein
MLSLIPPLTGMPWNSRPSGVVIKDSHHVHQLALFLKVVDQSPCDVIVSEQDHIFPDLEILFSGLRGQHRKQSD